MSRKSFSDIFRDRLKDSLDKSKISQKTFYKEEFSERDNSFEGILKTIEDYEKSVEDKIRLIDENTKYDNGIGKHLIGNQDLYNNFITLTGKERDEFITKENIDCLNSISAYSDGGGNYQYDYDPTRSFNQGTENKLKDEIVNVSQRMGMYTSVSWLGISILAIFLLMMKRFVRSVLFGLCGKLRIFGFSIGTLIVKFIVNLLNALFGNAVRFPYCKESPTPGDNFNTIDDLQKIIEQLLLNKSGKSDSICFGNVSNYKRKPSVIEEMMAKQLLKEIASNGYDSNSYDDNDVSTYIYYKNMVNQYDSQKKENLSNRQNVNLAYANVDKLNNVSYGAASGEQSELKIFSENSSKKIFNSYKNFLVFLDKGFTDIYNSMRLNLVVSSFFCCSIQLMIYLLIHFKNPKWTAEEIVDASDLNRFQDIIKDSEEYRKIITVTKIIELVIEFLAFANQTNVLAGYSVSVLSRKGFLENIQTIFGQSSYQFLTLILEIVKKDVSRLNEFIKEPAILQLIESCVPIKLTFGMFDCGLEELQKFFDNLFAEINQKSINNVLGFNFYISSISNRKMFSLLGEFLNYIFDNLGRLYIECFRGGLNANNIIKYIELLREKEGFKNYHGGDVQLKYDYDPNDITNSDPADDSGDNIRNEVEKFNNKFYSEYSFGRNILDNNIRIYEIIINRGTPVKKV